MGPVRQTNHSNRCLRDYRHAAGWLLRYGYTSWPAVPSGLRIPIQMGDHIRFLSDLICGLDQYHDDVLLLAPEQTGHYQVCRALPGLRMLI